MTLWSFSSLSFFLQLSSGFLHTSTAEMAKLELINVLEIIKEAFQIKVKKMCYNCFKLVPLLSDLVLCRCILRTELALM